VNVCNWANANRPLRINADQQRERRDPVECGQSAIGKADCVSGRCLTLPPFLKRLSSETGPYAKKARSQLAN